MEILKQVSRCTDFRSCQHCLTRSLHSAQVLTQLLLYYTRFQDIIRKSWKRPPAFAKDLVSTSAILAEIKKYALAI